MSETLEATVDSSLVEEWVLEFGTAPSATVPLLQAIQGKYGYLPRKAMDIVVETTEITGRQLYGVATFYSQFRLKPVGRHLIKVCHGTACHVTGADRLNTATTGLLGLAADSKEIDTAENGSYTIEDVACIGCCSQAPLMVIDDTVFGNLTGAKAQRELKKHAKANNEILPNA